MTSMNQDIRTSYGQALLSGDRAEARMAISAAMAQGTSAAQLLNALVWPMMEQIQVEYKEDRITTAMLNMATRLNRATADQLSSQLEMTASNGKKVLIFCGNAEPEELGGQICADLFEAAGYEVRFAGGGVPDDEVLTMIGQYRPDLLVMFATLASNVPSVRKLIDYLREVNSCPNMQVMCCGGIYKRAEGLAEEIGADLYAADAAMAVEVAANSEQRASVEQQTVGRMRRIRKAAIRKEAMATRTMLPPNSEAA